MALPLNTTPVYNLTIPSNGEKVRYRPFLIKEQKALLLAQQSEDPSVMVDTLKSIIKSCVTDDIDVDKLAMFDLEYIFIKLRAKSVGEVVELIMVCDEDHGEQDNKAKVKIDINLDQLEVQRQEGHSNKIDLFGDVGVVMKYPSFSTLNKFKSVNDSDAAFDVVAESIDYIYNSDEVFYAKDQTRKDLSEFIDNLTSDQFNKLQQFFATMPKLSKQVDYKCPVCGKEHKVMLEGVESFF